MKRLLLTAIAVSALAASPAIADTVADTAAGAEGWTQSDGANSNACFGQARAWWAQDLAENGSSNGAVISTRKGTNPQNNADFIAEYCGVDD